MKRKLMIVQLVWIICTGSIYGKRHSSESGPAIELNSIRTALVDTAFFQSVTVISLETDESSLIQSIERIYKMDGVYYLFDFLQRKVFMYNERGNYLGQINHIGNGPGEYVQISDMAIDRKRKNIVLFCDRPYKVMYYTLKGEFIKEVSCSDYYNKCAMDGDNIYCYKGGLKGDDRLLTYTYPFTLQREERLHERPFFHTQSAGTVISFNRGNFLTTSDALYLTRPFENCIYAIDEKGVHKKYEIDFKKRNLPQSLLEAGLSSRDFLNVCSKNQYVCGITDVIGNRDYILFNTNHGVYVYDKQSCQLNGYSFILNSNLDSSVSNLLSVDNTGSIAQIVQPTWFKHSIDNRHKRGKAPVKISPSYEKIYQKLQDDDNPVLIIYELPHKVTTKKWNTEE